MLKAVNKEMYLTNFVALRML